MIPDHDPVSARDPHEALGQPGEVGGDVEHGAGEAGARLVLGAQAGMRSRARDRAWFVMWVMLDNPDYDDHTTRAILPQRSYFLSVSFVELKSSKVVRCVYSIVIKRFFPTTGVTTTGRVTTVVMLVAVQECVLTFMNNLTTAQTDVSSGL